MKKLVKIKNNIIISIFDGIDINYAKQKGFEEREVEQAWDGGWYLKDYAPQKPLKELKQEEVVKYKKYLADTDYVVIKITEAMVIGNQQIIDELKNKYADVINERDEARKKINELEEEIKNGQEEIIEQIQEKDIISIKEVDENTDSNHANVVDGVKISSEQTEEQGEAMETMDVNKKEKNKLKEENPIEEKKELLFM